MDDSKDDRIDWTPLLYVVRDVNDVDLHSLDCSHNSIFFLVKCAVETQFYDFRQCNSQCVFLPLSDLPNDDSVFGNNWHLTSCMFDGQVLPQTRP